MTRELFVADPWVKPADLSGGTAFFKLTGEGRSRTGRRLAGPIHRFVNHTKLTASCLSRADAPLSRNDSIL